MPAGVSFSTGTLVGSTLTLTPAQLAGLTLTSDGETRSFSLHVVAGTTDAGSPAATAATDIAVTENLTRIDNVEAAIRASQGSAVYVVPGIELSTAQGHLLCYFGRSTDIGP